MSEVYRIEIPVEVFDRTSPGLENATKKVSKLETSIERTQRRMDQMNRTKLQIIASGLVSAQNSLNRMRSSLVSITGRTWRIGVSVATAPLRVLSSIKNTLFSLPTLLAGIAGGFAVQKGIVWPLEFAGNLEQAKIGFRTFLGDAQKAEKFMSDIEKFAAKTPFEQADVIEQAMQLLPIFHGDTNMIFRTLTAFGDAASLTGAGMDRMKLALLGFRQIATKGRLSMEELLQVTENLMVPMEPIREELGLTGAELANIGNQGIPAKRAMEAILRALERPVEKGGFLGGMSQMMQELSGQTSTFRDNIMINFIKPWGQGILSVVLPQLRGINDWFDGNERTLKDWSNRIEDAGRRLGNWFVSKINQVRDTLSELTNSQEWKDATTLGDKIRVGWDFLKDQFEEWWNRNKGSISSIFFNAGEFLGGTIKGGVMAALGIIDPSGSIDQNSFTSAGVDAGKSFMDGFLQGLDFNQIAKRLGEAFVHIQPGPGKSTGENVFGGLVDLLAASVVGGILSRVLKGGKFLLPLGGAIVGSSLGGNIGQTIAGDQGEFWGSVLGLLSGGVLFSRPVLRRITSPVTRRISSRFPRVFGGRKTISETTAPAASEVTVTRVPMQPTAPEPPKPVLLGPDGRPISSSMFETKTETLEDSAKSVKSTKGGSTFLGNVRNIFSKGLKVGSKGLKFVKGPGLLSVAIGGLSLATARTAEEKGGSIGSIAGGALGGALGSFLGPAGTFAGATLGSIAGEWLGKKATQLIFGKKNEDNVKNIPVAKEGEKPQINVNVTANPTFHIDTAVSADDVVNIVRIRSKEIGNIISDEVAQRLEEVSLNMP